MEQKTLAQAVGKTIAKKRKTLGFTQGVLAEKLNIEQESLSRMEKGLIAPKFSRLEAIAAALNCTVLDLFRTQDSDIQTLSLHIAEILQQVKAEEQTLILNVVETLVSGLKK